MDRTIMNRPNCTQLDEIIQDIVGRYCQGNGIDIGCGYSKIGACVGIDKIPWGGRISVKDKTKKISQADWAFDACSLPLKDSTMDFVYASHILEHIELNKITDKTKEALDEWIRILKSSGFLILVIPDIRYCITPLSRRKGLRIFHGLNPDDLKTEINKLTSVKLIKYTTLINKTVFIMVLRKN